MRMAFSNFVRAYFGYLLTAVVALWLILCVGIFNGLICGTLTRWDYLFPARILSCSAPKVDIMGMIKDGLSFMTQQVELEE